MLDLDGREQYTLAVRTGTKSAYVQLQLPYMAAPFDADAKRKEFLDRLRDEVRALPVDAKFPSLPLAELSRPEKGDALLHVLDWVLEELALHSKSPV
jgi:hypothetical protein